MPDISMCPSWQCPSRHSCRRNEASGTRPNDWRQSWMNFDEQRGLADRCESFWQWPPTRDGAGTGADGTARGEGGAGRGAEGGGVA